MDLTEIRREIDNIDDQIIQLLAQRGRLVSEAGRLKKNEQGVRDPRRVEQVIERVRAEASRAGIDPSLAEKIYRTIISCFISQEIEEFRERQSAPADTDRISVYLREDLPLKPNVPGAMMWAVGLQKSMLTWFELEPDTKFPEHSHEAEQITLVLDGELTFSYEGKTTVLRAGEVIAIPSNVVHSVTTGSLPCKAVDAWSPVRKEYL